MFNKSTIMKWAWGIYRENMAFVTYANAACKRLYFKDALQQAWSEAKNPPVAESAARKAIRLKIVAHESKDRWTQDDYAEMHRLNDELKRAA